MREPRELSRRAPALSEGERGGITPLSTSSPELKELLDVLLFAHEEVVANAKGCDTRPGSAKRFRAARSAIELSFATLTKEIADLRMLGKCVEGGMPIVSRYTEEYNKLEAENERLRKCDTCRRLQAKLDLNADDCTKEIDRLRATALNPEEAQSILNEIPGDGVWAMDSAVQKLLRARSLSGETPK